jgi:hypothetical protein
LTELNFVSTVPHSKVILTIVSKWNGSENFLDLPQRQEKDQLR